MDLLLQEEVIVQNRLRHKHGPEWRWRLMKLLIEKYDITQREENEKYLKSSMKKRMVKKKKYFFIQSGNLYRKIRKEGLYIIKKWPRYKKRAWVFHGLAINALRYNNPVVIKKEFPKYLKKALSFAKPKSEIARSSLSLLAEHYYNQKKYRVSIGYYNRLLKLEKNQWTTKHLLNLSWCYLQINKPKKALSLIKRTFRLSRSGKTRKKKPYVDYSSQVVKALPLFFERANRIGEGVNFFKKEKDDFQKRLMSMANFAKEKGKYKSTLYIYDALSEDAKANKGQKEINFILLQKMSLALAFKKEAKFKELTKILVKKKLAKKLSKEDRLAALEKVKKHVSVKQELLTKFKWGKTKALAAVLFYFDQIIKLDPSSTVEYQYYQGETLYSFGKYKDALEYYYRAIDFFKKNKNKNYKDQKLLTKIFDSIFSSMGKIKPKSKVVYEKRVLAYKNYLEIFPNGKKASKIYQRLFNTHYKEGYFLKAKAVLLLYALYYSKRAYRKKQQSMLVQLLSHNIKTNNLQEISYWLNKLDDGFLNFKPSYVEEISRIRNDIVFSEVSKEKDVNIANDKYKDIYYKKDYSRFIRAKSAYYLAQNYLQVLNVAIAFSWLKKSLNMAEKSKYGKFEEGVLVSIQKMVYLQDFSNAHQLASYSLQQFCLHKEATLKDDLYNAGVVYAMIDEQYDVAYQNFNIAKKCGISLKSKLKNLKYMARFHFTHENYTHLDKLFLSHKMDKNFYLFFSRLALAGYWSGFLQKSSDLENYSWSYLKDITLRNIKSKKVREEVKAVLKFHRLRDELSKINGDKFSLYDVPGKFNEEHFNKILDEHIAKLGKFTKKITGYLTTGYPQIIFYGHYVLFRRYQSFGQALLSFRPMGVDKSYLDSFVQTMSGLGRQFLRQADNHHRLGINLIKKKKGLFRDSGKVVLNRNHVASQINYRYPASLYGLTLDKAKGK